MNPINRRQAARQRSAWLGPLYLVGGLCLGAAAQVGASPPEHAWHANASSVLELLQADTRRAFEGLRAAEPPRDAAPAAPVNSGPKADRIELAALYGTAGRFTAVVYVNGVRKEYRPGAKLPYAGGGSASEYRLLRIVDSCVILQKAKAARVRSACFRPASEADTAPSLAGSTALAAGDPGAALNTPLPVSVR